MDPLSRVGRSMNSQKDINSVILATSYNWVIFSEIKTSSEGYQLCDSGNMAIRPHFGITAYNPYPYKYSTNEKCEKSHTLFTTLLHVE